MLRVRSATRTIIPGQILPIVRGDPKAQLEQEFVGDPLFTPDRILRTHLADEVSEVAGELWPAARPGLPAPEQPKTYPMPSNKRIALDHAEGRL